MKPKNVLVLGGTGMLGHTLFRALSNSPGLNVYATVRSLDGLSDRFTKNMLQGVRTGVDADNFDDIARTLTEVKPDVVINCIGLIKQLPQASDPATAITINALLPHRLASACRTANARLIHISTDCVFDGRKGNYTEQDTTNADDLYGRTKMLGEISGPNCLTLRTSIIGHELKTRLGLLEWFLAQTSPVRGFTKAIYSGFPTIELVHIIADYVLPNPDLQGIYNVSTSPISKYELLRIVARHYGKHTVIEPFDGFSLDRSLNSAAFKARTGYTPPSWEQLIEKMRVDYRAHLEIYHAVV